MGPCGRWTRRTSRGGGVVVMVNQRNDWLHRGPKLAFLDLWGYSQHVTRTEMPMGGSDKMADNEYTFAEHYSLFSSKVQRYCPTERPPKLPVVEGYRCPTVVADPQMNALYKSVLLRPFACEAAGPDGRCDKLQPYDCSVRRIVVLSLF